MRNILILIILISGLIFTSHTKNKTRLLEKELANLNNEITILNSNLSEATLDYEYLTTPKNISFLASNLLDENFSYYEKSQISKLNEEKKDLDNLKNSENYRTSNQFTMKKKIIENPNEENNYNIGQLLIVKQFTNEETQKDKHKLDPKEVQKWVGIQVVKALLGFPIVPIK